VVIHSGTLSSLCCSFFALRAKKEQQMKSEVPSAAAWYFTIICVRFFRAERGKTEHQLIDG
jgi:hypothetical protein